MIKKIIKCDDGTTKALLVPEKKAADNNNEHETAVPVLGVICVVASALLGAAVGGYILWVLTLKPLFMFVKEHIWETVVALLLITFVSYLWHWTGNVFPMPDDKE